MAEFMPKSIIGKHPYIIEYGLLMSAQDHIFRSMLIANTMLKRPLLGVQEIPVIKAMPYEMRYRKFKRHLEIAKKRLEELGV